MSPVRNKPHPLAVTATLMGFALSTLPDRAHGSNPYTQGSTSDFDESTQLTAIAAGAVVVTGLIVTAVVVANAMKNKRRHRPSPDWADAYVEPARLTPGQQYIVQLSDRAGLAPEPPPMASLPDDAAYSLLISGLIASRGDLAMELGLLATSPAAFDQFGDEVNIGTGPGLKTIASAAGTEESVVCDAWLAVRADRGLPDDPNASMQFIADVLGILGPSLAVPSPIESELVWELVRELAQPDFPSDDAVLHQWLAEWMGLEPADVHSVTSIVLADFVKPPSPEPSDDADARAQVYSEAKLVRAMAALLEARHPDAIATRLRSLQADTQVWRPEPHQVLKLVDPKTQLVLEKAIALDEGVRVDAWRRAIEMYRKGEGTHAVLEQFIVEAIADKTFSRREGLMALGEAGRDLSLVTPYLSGYHPTINGAATRALVRIAERTNEHEAAKDIISGVIDEHGKTLARTTALWRLDERR